MVWESSLSQDFCWWCYLNKVEKNTVCCPLFLSLLSHPPLSLFLSLLFFFLSLLFFFLSLLFFFPSLFFFFWVFCPFSESFVPPSICLFSESFVLSSESCALFLSLSPFPFCGSTLSPDFVQSSFSSSYPSKSASFKKYQVLLSSMGSNEFFRVPLSSCGSKKSSLFLKHIKPYPW